MLTVGPIVAPFPANSTCTWSPWDKHRKSGPHMIVDRPYCVYCGAKDVEFTFSEQDRQAEGEWLRRTLQERESLTPPWESR